MAWSDSLCNIEGRISTIWIVPAMYSRAYERGAHRKNNNTAAVRIDNAALGICSQSVMMRLTLNGTCCEAGWCEIVANGQKFFLSVMGDHSYT